MSTIVSQILVALSSIFGTSSSSQAQSVYSSGKYHICNGVVIIDTDEL